MIVLLLGVCVCVYVRRGKYESGVGWDGMEWGRWEWEFSAVLRGMN